jgi:signal transduction histidine kinase
VPAGLGGLKLAFLNASASAVWPPTGLSLAALLLAGPGLWPAVLAGAFLVNLATSGAWAPSAAIAAGNTLEALAGWWLVRRFANGDRFTASARDVCVAVAAAGLGATAISATVGTSSLCAFGLESWERFRPVWFTWWLGDLLSVVIVTPLFLAWLRPAGPPMGRSALELAGLAALAAAVDAVVFFSLAPGMGNYPLAFLAIPPMVLAGLRAGTRGATASCFLLSGIAVLGTLRGGGPFAVADEHTSLLLVQAFTGVISLTGLALGAVVDERARVRAELKRFNQELEARVAARTKELEAFAYSVSHDLRAPLRAIDGFSRLAANEAGLSNEARENLSLVRDAVRRMGRNIDGLLALYRLSQTEPVRRTLDVSALAAEAAEALRRAEPARRVELSIQPGLSAEGDLDLVRIVLQNLLDNAWKFTSKRADARVSVAAASRGGKTAFAVQDNGAGFDPAYAHQLFRPFRRLHAETEFPGTGIGLATVKAAIERHGGEIWLESRPDAGTTVFFTLP